MPPDPYEIAEMPDRNLLKDFLRGLAGDVTVLFNTDTRKFERIRPEHALEAGLPGAGSPPAGVLENG